LAEMTKQDRKEMQGKSTVSVHVNIAFESTFSSLVACSIDS